MSCFLCYWFFSQQALGIVSFVFKCGQCAVAWVIYYYQRLVNLESKFYSVHMKMNENIFLFLPWIYRYFRGFKAQAPLEEIFLSAICLRRTSKDLNFLSFIETKSWQRHQSLSDSKNSHKKILQKNPPKQSSQKILQKYFSKKKI